jgi:hypothetical protein
MNIKRILLMGLVIVLALAPASAAFAYGDGGDIREVRRATSQFHRTEAAQAAGYDLVPGLDHCFENPGVGGMGFHYINVDILDLILDPLQPEAMVYAPGPNGQL